MKKKFKRYEPMIKQKIIYEHIRSLYDKSINLTFGFYADNKLVEISKAPTNIHGKYKVVDYCYYIKNIRDVERNKIGFTATGIIQPIWNKCKVIRIKKWRTKINTI